MFRLQILERSIHMGLKCGHGVAIGARLLGWWPGGPECITSRMDLCSVAGYQMNIYLTAQNGVRLLPSGFCGPGA